MTLPLAHMGHTDKARDEARFGAKHVHSAHVAWDRLAVLAINAAFWACLSIGMLLLIRR